MQGDDIRFAQEGIEGNGYHSGGSELLGRHGRIVAEHRHAESLSDARHAEPDVAEADDAENLVLKLVARVDGLRPFSLPDQIVRTDDPPGDREEKPEGLFGNRIRICARGVGHKDSEIVARLNIDLVESSSVE